MTPFLIVFLDIKIYTSHIPKIILFLIEWKHRHTKAKF